MSPVYSDNDVVLMGAIIGKELFIRGVTEELKDKHMVKFFKKNGIAVESVELAKGKR